MQLKEARLPFLGIDSSPSQDFAKSSHRIRIAFLTEQQSLRATLDLMLPSSRYDLTQTCDIGLLETKILDRTFDVAVIDIESKDAWPGSVFSQFDEVAASFPVIILCKDPCQISKYLWKAKHVIDIFSHDSVCDPRFPSLIEAAAFRAEVISRAEQAHAHTPETHD